MKDIPTTADLVEAERLAAGAALGSDRPAPRFITPTALPGETYFRHGGWINRRRRVHAALQTAGVSYARINRFEQCGACAVVEYSKELKKYRVTAHFCHDRWCQPCAHARARALRTRLSTLVDYENLRFVTLTLKHRDATLRDEIVRLRTAWVKLRKTRLWKDRVTGGVASMEIKTGADGLWHVHMHIMIQSSFMPQAELSKEWLRITTDSHIVDVRRINDARKACGYVTKYITKGIDAETFKDNDRLAEAISAMKGTRVADTFGTWRGEIEENDGNDPGDWEPIATIRDLELGLREAQPWAIALARNLHRTPLPEHDADAPDG